jgi:hypothetical protein
MDFLPEGLRPFATLFPVMLAFMLLTVRLRFARKGGPSRLLELYPAVAPAPGTRIRMDRAMFGRGYFSMAWVRIGADHERLHIRVVSSFQRGRSFSVPLEEVTVTPDRYGWMVLAPDTVRLRFARAPAELMMIFPGDFAKLAEASGGRLRLEAALVSEARAPAPAGGSS